MSTLSNASLIEVIFEFRWGQLVKDEHHADVGIKLRPEEVQFFFGQFKAIAETYEFTHIERINPKLINPLPHIVTYRFRKSPDIWPCYQIGLGILTVNQLVEGYDWNVFKDACLLGIELLDKGHPLTLEGLERQKIGIQLQYQDAFVFFEHEESLKFLRTKLNIGLETPDNFVKYENFIPAIKNIVFSFEIDVKKPKGILNITVQEGFINNKAGMIMNTILRSSDADLPALAPGVIGQWLDETHLVQKHAFESLINPTYLKSLK